MSKIDHRRPELRFLDNLKRELAPNSASNMETAEILDWPNSMRPFAESAIARTALYDALQAFSTWIDDPDCSFSPTNAPRYVSKAFHALAHARVHDRYDQRLTVSEWLKRPTTIDENAGIPVYHTIVAFLELMNSHSSEKRDKI